MSHIAIDNRKFGRRRALIHANVVNSMGGLIPCLVRNISAGGALLEAANNGSIPQRMTLIVESDDFEAECEVRHRTQHGVGVLFHKVRVAPNGIDTRFAGPELLPAMQSLLIGDLPG